MYAMRCKGSSSFFLSHLDWSLYVVCSKKCVSRCIISFFLSLSLSSLFSSSTRSSASSWDASTLWSSCWFSNQQHSTFGRREDGRTKSCRTCLHFHSSYSSLNTQHCTRTSIRNRISSLFFSPILQHYRFLARTCMNAFTGLSYQVSSDTHVK